MQLGYLRMGDTMNLQPRAWKPIHDAQMMDGRPKIWYGAGRALTGMKLVNPSLVQPTPAPPPPPKSSGAWEPIRDAQLMDGRPLVWMGAGRALTGMKIVNPSADHASMGAWGPIHDAQMMDARPKVWGMPLKGSTSKRFAY